MIDKDIEKAAVKAVIEGDPVATVAILHAIFEGFCRRNPGLYERGVRLLDPQVCPLEPVDMSPRACRGEGDLEGRASSPLQYKYEYEGTGYGRPLDELTSLVGAALLGKARR